MIDNIHSEEFHQQLVGWCKGDQQAAAFLYKMAILTRHCDDLVDEIDKDDPQARMVAILETFFLGVANDPFFEKNKAYLTGVISTMIAGWVAGDRWRGSDERKKQMFAFVRRENTDNLVIAVAALCGGFLHANMVHNELYEAAHKDKETFEEWLGEETKVVDLKKDKS